MASNDGELSTFNSLKRNIDSVEINELSLVASMIRLVASYATGLGKVPWQQGEFFSLEASNWAGNLLIGSTYLSLMARFTPAGAFGFYAGLCLLGWIFVLCSLPETAGLSLEDVKMVFRTGFGIKDSTKKDIRHREKQRREGNDDAVPTLEKRAKWLDDLTNHMPPLIA